MASFQNPRTFARTGIGAAQSVLRRCASAVLVFGAALLALSQPAKAAGANAQAIIKAIDARMFYLHRSPAKSFTAVFNYSGLDEFLKKNMPKSPVNPVEISWKKSDGRGVGYHSKLPDSVREASYLILKEYKDVYLPPTLEESMRGLTLSAFATKTGWHLTGVVVKKPATPMQFIRVDIDCDKAYKVSRMSFVTKKGAQIAQNWDLKATAQGFVPEKITIVSMINKLSIARQVSYVWQSQGGLWFPKTVTIKSKSGKLASRIETIEFKDWKPTL